MLPAYQACARSRKHSVPVLVRNVHRVLETFLLDRWSRPLRAGLQGEVDATPKPGLVDRDNAGAHKDMDWHTFAASTDAIVPYLRQMAEKRLGLGRKWGRAVRSPAAHGGCGGKGHVPATGNVNTHKGIIFSLGLVTSFTLWLLARTGTVWTAKKPVCHWRSGDTPFWNGTLPKSIPLPSPYPRRGPVYPTGLPGHPGEAMDGSRR